MQRSARVAIHVGGRHAQNGQGLALRREGKSIEVEAKFVRAWTTTGRPKALQGCHFWTAVWVRDFARGWTDQLIRLSRHADETSGALCGGRASAGAPSQFSFLGPPLVCTKTGSPRCSFTLLACADSLA